jgi:hypothetical protein
MRCAGVTVPNALCSFCANSPEEMSVLYIGRERVLPLVRPPPALDGERVHLLGRARAHPRRQDQACVIDPRKHTASDEDKLVDSKTQKGFFIFLNESNNFDLLPKKTKAKGWVLAGLTHLCRRRASRRTSGPPPLQPPPPHHLLHRRGLFKGAIRYTDSFRRLCWLRQNLFVMFWQAANFRLKKKNGGESGCVGRPGKGRDAPLSLRAAARVTRRVLLYLSSPSASALRFLPLAEDTAVVSVAPASSKRRVGATTSSASSLLFASSWLFFSTFACGFLAERERVVMPCSTGGTVEGGPTSDVFEGGAAARLAPASTSLLMSLSLERIDCTVFSTAVCRVLTIVPGNFSSSRAHAASTHTHVTPRSSKAHAT